MDDKAQVIEAIEKALNDLVGEEGAIQIVINERAAMRRINGRWGYYTVDARGWELETLDRCGVLALGSIAAVLLGYVVVKAQGGDWVGMQPALIEPAVQMKLF
jgi:hypothetical protein